MNLPNGNARLRGAVVDEAALHGILSRIPDLGLPLVSVTEIAGASSLLETTVKEELK